MNARAIATLLITSCLCAAAGKAAAADPYPTRPIRLIVPTAPGGATDVFARLIAQKMSETLKQPAVVENVAGAGTVLGGDRVAKSAPDGYTLLVATTATLATTPHLYKKLPYKLEDFAPISMVAKFPMVLVVNPSSPLNSFRDFAVQAKANPGKVSYGTAGLGGTAHLVGKMIESALGTTLLAVHYKGAAPAMVDLMSGQTDAYIDAIATSLPLWRAGRIKVLGVTSDTRVAAAQAIPTFAESGYPDVVYFNLFSMVAPAGTPKPIIDVLNAAVVQALKSDEIRNRMLGEGTIPDPTTTAGAAAGLKADYDIQGRIIKTTGIQLD